MKNRDKLRPTRAQKIAMGLPKPRKPHAATKLAEGLRDYQSRKLGRSPLVDVDFAKLEDQFPEARQ